MQSFPQGQNTETAAHLSRTEELARRLGIKLGMHYERLLEACGEFDAAAEFAALEGLTVGEALRRFLAEGSDAHYPAVGTIPPYGRLPVEPRAVSRLLRTSVETVSTGELEDIAGSDPVLAARLLSAANSAISSSRHEISRLREAILRLGIPESRRVLVTASMGGLFASRALHDLWEHSEAVAQAAATVATQVGVDCEAAWIAGLLHDIGRVVMATGPAEVQAAEQRWSAAGFPLVYAEALASGQDHAEVGAALLRQWELPDEIVEAVALHHRPECSDSKLVAVICLAEEMVATRFNTAPEDLWQSMRKTIACQRSGFAVEAFAALNLRSEARVCA